MRAQIILDLCALSVDISIRNHLVQIEFMQRHLAEYDRITLFHLEFKDSKRLAQLVKVALVAVELLFRSYSKPLLFALLHLL